MFITPGILQVLLNIFKIKSTLMLREKDKNLLGNNGEVRYTYKYFSSIPFAICIICIACCGFIYAIVELFINYL